MKMESTKSCDESERVPLALRMPRVGPEERRGFALAKLVLASGGVREWLLHAPDCRELAPAQCGGCRAIDCSWLCSGHVRVRAFAADQWSLAPMRAADLRMAVVIATQHAEATLPRPTLTPPKPTRTPAVLGPRPRF
jgi:hypothetical protein